MGIKAMVLHLKAKTQGLEGGPPTNVDKQTNAKQTSIQRAIESAHTEMLRVYLIRGRGEKRERKRLHKKHG